MILKHPPEVFFTGGVLTKAIGAPEDYVKNKENGFFAEHTDLRIIPYEAETQQSDSIIPT